MKPPARAPERDYSHRGVVDKLGVKPGAAVQFDDAAWPLDDHLKAEILARAGRPCAEQGEQADVVLVSMPFGELFSRSPRTVDIQKARYAGR